jgi:hypothetical protein
MSSPLRRRPARVVPAVVVALVLLVLALALLLVCVQRVADGVWAPGVESTAGSLEAAAWSSRWAWPAAILTALVGLALLLCALLPGGRKAVLLEPLDAHELEEGAEAEAVLSSSGLAALASAAASEVDGVGSVRTSASDRDVRIRVTTPLRSDRELVREVTSAVQERLADAGVARTPSIRVRTRTKEVS